MIKKYRLEIVVFLCGMAVMILELDGSRILAPYLGTTIFVWTSLIGVILGSLSLGYFFGGKIADKSPKDRNLAFIITVASIFVLFISLIKDPFLKFTEDLDIRTGSLLASIVFFSVPSVLLGTVSPYAAKLKLENLTTSGRTVGNLYAISTLGSILGTFAAGFWLIPFFGNTQILYLVCGLLVLSVLTISLNFIKISFFIFLAILLSFSFNFFSTQAKAKNGKLDIDSVYSRIIVEEGVDKNTGKRVRTLSTDQTSTQSAIFLDDKELVFDYTRFYRLIEHFNANKNVLMIGGGAFTYPIDFLSKHPDSKIDVVEIDPKMVEIAQKYFYLKEDERMRIVYEDGRTYLNHNKNSYDAVLIDAYKSINPPYQLTTKEAAEKISHSLNENGVVIANLLTAVKGKNSKFLWSEYETYKTIFPKVYIFKIKNLDEERLQNVMLVALKQNNELLLKSSNEELQTFLNSKYTGLSEKGTVLTDDYAPTDTMISP